MYRALRLLDSMDDLLVAVRMGWRGLGPGPQVGWSLAAALLIALSVLATL